MDGETTLTIFAASAMLTVVAAAGDYLRRRKPDGVLALLPWHGLLFLGVAVMLFMAAHALTLARE